MIYQFNIFYFILVFVTLLPLFDFIVKYYYSIEKQQTQGERDGDD